LRVSLKKAEKMQKAGAFSKGAALMKLSLLILALIAAALTLATTAHAQNYPWCAIYSGGAVGGGTNCGFVSFEQCMATASGLGSFCSRNTQYVPPPGPHSQRRYYPY
jgi:Protein of unknown function (DUF3551)